MSKITPEARARCTEHTLKAQLEACIARTKSLEQEVSIAKLERLLIEKQVTDLSPSWTDQAKHLCGD
jgi:lipoprotein NlpI